MNKNILLLLSFSSIIYPMEPAKKTVSSKEEPLYLVVGSTRRLNEVFRLPCFPFTQLWQDHKSKLAHGATYGGKATTMDLDSIPLPLKHIVGDASTYDFKDKVIRAAYLEGLPTLNMCHNCSKLQSLPTENYLGACIQNIGKAMRPGAVMEIEWHPFVHIFDTDPKSIRSMFCEEEIRKNPFTISITRDLACVALEMACDQQIPPGFEAEVSPEFVLCAKELSMTFKELLAFYEEKNIGTKELLIRRIDQELWLWYQLSENGGMALLSDGPSGSLEDFSAAIKSIVIAKRDPAMVGKRSIIKKENKEFNGTFYDANLFASGTFFNFMLCEAGIMHNTQYVKEFMEKSGFKHVTIKRTTSKRNGRENVWIVRGKI